MRLRTHTAHAGRVAFVEDGAPVVIGLVGRERLLHGRALRPIRTLRHPAPAQECIHRRRVDDLVEVENAGRVPAALHLAHHSVHLLPVHQGNEFAAQAPVSVLAAQAPLVPAHQARGPLRDLAERSPPFCGLEVQDRAQVEFAGADMTIEYAAQTHLVEDFPELLQVSGQALRSDGGIFDDADRARIALHAAQHAEAGFAQLPDFAHFRAVGPGAGVGEALRLQVGLEGRRPRIQILAIQFRHQQRGRRPLHDAHQATHGGVGTGQVEDLAVNQLDGGGIMLERHQVGLVALFERIAVGADDHFPDRRQGVERQFDLRHESQSPL